jgi:DNA-binding FadR family transcriptional regulator
VSTKAARAVRSLPANPAGERGRGLLGAVVEELGLRIVKGRYRPGHPLPTEPELMSELEISRTVLREAVKILGAKGLLVSRPRSGTRVLPPRNWNLLDPVIIELYCRVGDYSQFAKNFQMLRAIIEPEAAAIAAAQRTQKQIKILAAAYGAMENARSLDEWTAADLAFHEAILEATGNPFMLPLASLIRAALNTLLFNSARTSADPFGSLAEHGHVLVAIRRRDAQGARKAMKTLLAGTELSISKTVRGARAARATAQARYS